MTVSAANETIHPGPDAIPAQVLDRHVRATVLRTSPRQRTEEPDELALKARGELLVLAPAGMSTPDGRVYQLLVERGVRVRVVQEPQTRGYIQGAARGEVELRRLQTVPHTLVLVDRRTALLTTGGGTVTVHQPALVEALLLLFTSLWQRARPEGAAPARSHRDVAVLNLLATGATDEVVAARLGVSIRTYRRWVADLMARLGATSRFQAGVLASLDGSCSDPVAAAATRPDPTVAAVRNADRYATGQQVRGPWTRAGQDASTSSATMAGSCHRGDVDQMARPA